MSDILWSMTNYLRFHLGDNLVLGSARQYGSYWDIPGGDVKVEEIEKIGLYCNVPDSGWVHFLGEHSCVWDNRKDG